MAGKKNGVEISTEALVADDARIATPKQGDKMTDVKAAYEAWCARKGYVTAGMRQQITAQVRQAGATKKKGGR